MNDETDLDVLEQRVAQLEQRVERRLGILERQVAELQRVTVGVDHPPERPVERLYETPIGSSVERDDSGRPHDWR